MTNIMELERERLFTWTKPEDGNPSLAHFRALARELGIWLQIGSMSIKLSEEKLANRAFLISPEGAVTARYDKIHMFDVSLPNGETYRESRRYVSGKDVVVAPLPWGGLGITICYDMRFPAVYRALAKAGADFLTMPSAFTKQTGEAHWHILLRARAIEAQCYVFAAAQGGKHENGRETYGHSLIVDPWGRIVAEAKGVEPGVVVAEIDPAKVADARQRLPSLEHDRPFGVVSLGANDKSAGERRIKEAS
jgi:predicted amidohydrolase